MFSGYGDGLIAASVWDFDKPQPNDQSVVPIPLLGHTNKINQLLVVEPIGKLFSASNDCTMRQWPVN